MTTLIEAAQDVIACANPLGTTSNVRVPKYVMAALEQAIAQEQEIARRCYTCKSFAIRNVDKCRSCNKDYSNWEPKP